MADLDSVISQFNREEEESYAEREAQSLGISYADLSRHPIPEDVAGLFSEEEMLKYSFVPYLKVGHKVRVGACRPTDQEFIELIKQSALKNRIEIMVAKISKTSFQVALAGYKKIISERQNATKHQDNYSQITTISSVAELTRRTSMTELLELIVGGAAKLKASDIHIEPSENDFITRYRIDGVLQDTVRLPISIFQQIINRIMFLSKMKMDQKDSPQDGSFTLKYTESQPPVDMRVSIMPSNYGQAVVIRLMGQEDSILTLDTFGFRPDALAAIKEAVSRPHGMILTSGPTGSGKSSTMYSILLFLRKPGIKIITLENPVEFKIAGIEQSPVHPGDGYEFSDGLRASLRQDPDILMVGEIRDAETAEIAVQAAMTGHLLLSTVHANSAPAVYVRLLQIGVRPFLLAGSINLIMAQRLIRKVCPDCHTEYSPKQDEWKFLKNKLTPVKDRLGPEIAAKLESTAPKMTKGAGCATCNNTGYKGRQVVVEYLIPDKDIEKLVVGNATIADFDRVATERGMITMEQDGLVKALLGQTTIDEVQRMTKS